MGWWADLQYNVCPHCERGDGLGFDWNCTSNLSPMFAEALGRSILSLNGLSAREVAEVLRPGIDAMEADPARFQAMNPPNGWGTYEGALRVLGEIYVACRKCNGATFTIMG